MPGKLLRCGNSRIDVWGNYIHRQIIYFLKIFSADRHQASIEVQPLEGKLRRTPIPPSSTFCNAIIFKIPRHQWTFARNSIKYCLHQIFFCLRQWFSPGQEAFLQRQREAEVAHGNVSCSVGPEFEDLSIGLKLFKPFPFIVRDPRYNSMVMCTFDNINRIDLNKTKMVDEFINSLLAFAKLSKF